MFLCDSQQSMHPLPHCARNGRCWEQDRHSSSFHAAYILKGSDNLEGDNPNVTQGPTLCQVQP